MQTLEIRIQPLANDHYPVVALSSEVDSLSPRRLEGAFPAERLKPAALQEVAYDALAYGTILGQALFSDPGTQLIRDLLHQAYARSLGRNVDEAPLRLLLEVEAPTLREYYWQRLAAPLGNGSDWALLARNSALFYSLYLPSSAARSFPPFGPRDLRALVVVASPPPDNAYHLAPFSVTDALRGVLDALGDTPSTVLANPEPGSGVAVVGPPTFDAIRRQLITDPFTCLHVVAHGSKSSTERKPIVFLLNDQGEVEGRSASDWIAQLKEIPVQRTLPHLAFLSVCESAATEGERAGAFGGLAQQLVRDLGMPAVVAMTERITVSTANTLAANFYERLKRHGEVDRALAEATIAIADAPDSTVPALYTRLAARPLFSFDYDPDRPLSAHEISAGLAVLAQELPRRAPIFEPEFRAPEALLRGMADTQPAALAPVQRNERKAALQTLNKISTETLEVTFTAVAVGVTLPSYDDRPPFMGLSAFRQSHQAFFFGRDRLVTRVVSTVLAHPFVAVLGGSGTGKSSLVLAGALPQLERATPALLAVDMTPGETPLATLTDGLAKMEATGAQLLVVDQFEELFTLTRDPEEQRAFIAALIALLPAKRVILTMRSDFFGDVQKHPTLLKQITDQSRIDVLAMDASELRAAAESQAAVVGLRFEAGLLDRMVAEVEEEAGAMPLMQHALLELWRRRRGRWLLLKEYEALGGVQAAIAKTADDIYTSFPLAQQRWFRQIFLRLTRVDDTLDPEQGTHRDTRRRIEFHNIVPTQADPTLIRQIVQGLADKRLVTTKGATLENSTVEVTHEALIQKWDLLKSWLDEDREWLTLRQDILADAQRWEQNGRADDYLGRWTPDTARALALVGQAESDLNRLETEYLQATQRKDEQERQQEADQLQSTLQLAQDKEAAERRTSRLLSVSLAGAVVLIVLAVGAALFARNRATVAVAARATAQANEATAEAAEGRAEVALSTATVALGESERARKEQAMAVADAQAARDTARRNEALTLVRRLAAEALARRTLNPALSRLLAVEAYQRGQALSPEAKTIAVETFHQVLAISAGMPLNPSDEEYGYGNMIVYSPDGQLVVQRSREFAGTMTLHAVSAEGVTSSVVLLSGFDQFAFSPDSRYLVTWDRFLLRLYTLATLDAPPKVYPANRIDILQFTSDSRAVLFALGSTLLRWDVEQEEPRSLLPDQLSPETRSEIVWRARISPDGRWLMGDSTSRGPLFVVDLSSPSSAPLTREQDSGAIEYMYSPSGRWFAAAMRDRSIHVWDMSRMNTPLLEFPDEAVVLTGHEDRVTQMAFDSSGRWLATGAQDGVVRVWDIPSLLSDGSLITDNAAFTFRNSDDGISSVSFRENRLIATSNDGFYTWFIGSPALNMDVGTRRLTGVINEPQYMAWIGIAENPATWRIVWQDSFNIELWDFSNPSEGRTTLNTAGLLVGDVDIDVSGRYLVLGTWEGEIWIWDLERLQEPVAIIPNPNPEIAHNRVRPLTILKDGTIAATYELENSTRLWDPRAYGITIPAQSTDNDVVPTNESPDGRYSAEIPTSSLAREYPIHLYDRTTPAAPPVRLLGHSAAVEHLQFSPDGRWLATTGLDDTIHIWTLEEAELLDLACRTAGRNMSQDEWQTFFGDEPYRLTCANWTAHSSVRPTP